MVTHANDPLCSAEPVSVYLQYLSEQWLFPIEICLTFLNDLFQFYWTWTGIHVVGAEHLVFSDQVDVEWFNPAMYLTLIRLHHKPTEVGRGQLQSGAPE